MTRRRRRGSAVYQVYLEPQVHARRRELPGNVRQRLKREIEGLSTEPRPHHSRVLDLSKVEDELSIPEGIEVRRLRLDRWRVIYAVDESWQTVIVLALRQRPPYDYEDLDKLITGLANS
jgi:mRNA interferase RelE/StbE